MLYNLRIFCIYVMWLFYYAEMAFYGLCVLSGSVCKFYNTEASMERMNSGDCWSFVSFLQLRGEVLLNQFTAMETTLFLNPSCTSNLS